MALDDARSRVERARSDESARAAATAWAKARSLLEGRAACVERVQSLAVDLATEHAKLLELTEAAWEALPISPSFRPATFGNDITVRLATFLHGQSNGRLGEGAGTSAYVNSQKPDLVSQSAGAVEILLAPSQPTPADQPTATA